jgi:hypothetical protein
LIGRLPNASLRLEPRAEYRRQEAQALRRLALFVANELSTSQLHIAERTMESRLAFGMIRHRLHSQPPPQEFIRLPSMAVCYRKLLHELIRPMILTASDAPPLAAQDRGVVDMDQGIRAAVGRFPTRQRAIEALAARNDDFRSLCADLAEAQVALRRWEQSSSLVREQRCSEYASLVESLASEIEDALEAASIIPLAAARTRKRPYDHE